MAKYIKKETAIRALLNDSPEQVGYSREDAADCIRYMDTADVAPVRHGRWLNIEEYTVLSYNTYFPMTTTSETCSECSVRSAFLGKKSYVKDNHCPNCGATMNLED